MQTMSNYDAVLKEFYENLIKEQLNNEILLKKWLVESSRQWAGRHIRFAVHTKRNPGVGARAESGALPVAGQQTNVECRVTAAYIYGRIDLTGQVMAAGKNAFAEAMSHEMEGVTNDLQFDCTRQSYGEGLGILAQISTDSCATSISVFNQFAEPGQPGARYIQDGQLIDVGVITNPDSVSGASGATVIGTTISLDSGTTSDTITISASMDLISSSEFVFAHLATGVGIEMKGLRAIVDDSTAAHVYGYSGGMLSTVTLQNVDSNAQPRWNASVLANSQTERLIDSHLMQRAFDSNKRKSGKQPDLIMGEYDVVSAFLDSVSNDRRYATKDFDTGRGVLSYNGISLVQDLQAPFNELYLLNRESIKWAVLKDFGFDSEDGSILKNVAGFDRHEAFIKAYINVYAEHRNGNTVIRDIRTSL